MIKKIANITKEIVALDTDHLKPGTKKFYDATVNTYELEEHHLKILLLACESWDRAVDAQLALNEHGLTYIDNKDCPRSRPEIKIKEQAEIIFSRLIRELCLDIEAPRDGPGRPPRLF